MVFLCALLSVLVIISCGCTICSPKECSQFLLAQVIVVIAHLMMIATLLSFGHHIYPCCFESNADFAALIESERLSRDVCDVSG